MLLVASQKAGAFVTALVFKIVHAVKNVHAVKAPRVAQGAVAVQVVCCFCHKQHSGTVWSAIIKPHDLFGCATVAPCA